MATLVRSKTASATSAQSSILLSQVPTPFSREELDQIRSNSSSASQPAREILSGDDDQDVYLQSDQSQEVVHEEISSSVLSDLLPSIYNVQKSCIMTLNDLLSSPTHWSPIVPDRRHSMPNGHRSSLSQESSTDSPSSAFHTLVTNLRQQQAQGEMVQTTANSSDTELLHELQIRIETISPSLEQKVAALADALVSLLSHFNRLSAIYATSCKPDARPFNRGPLDPESAPPADSFDMLKRQLSDLQSERLSSQLELLPKNASPVLTVETALLWSRIDVELETVVSLCKERAEKLTRTSIDLLPPEYDARGYDFEDPPEYDVSSNITSDETKTRAVSTQQNARFTDEKMRMDLEAVTMAIDRLYMAAPQLHNQRVELKSSKLAELERARREGTSVASAQRSQSGKQKEHDIRDLESLLDKLGKASERKLEDQAVVLEGGMQARLERVRKRNLEKRDAFVEKLAKHSQAGRLHDQDATLQPRTKDPNALLTLPEFIREAVPQELVKSDPRALLSLPEFAKEPPPPHLVSSKNLELSAPEVKQKSRNRSLSAPPLSWLRSSSSRTNLSRQKSRNQITAFDVCYVAEHYENLHHILVFFTASGATPGVDIEAEVPPSTTSRDSELRNDYLVLRSGSLSSPRLILPGVVPTGKKEVKVQGSHLEVKLFDARLPQPRGSEAFGNGKALLDASQLLSSCPTSFICASCSLPIIQSSRVKDYRDLPSEHWEELVEAWMCHSDQKLHEHIVKHGKHSFYPKEGQALVGGSYILFQESAVNQINLNFSNKLKNSQDWTIVRCLCGNVVGRCQRHESENGNGSSMVYRILKYAIRPVSPTCEPLKIPLTAFIVGDMMEYVSAHATYRFIIQDEEEERPRILIWLFRPNMRISYSATSHRIIPKSDSIHASKVLYKLLGPAESKADFKSLLSKYPGFPQAEYLSYPMDVCQRLAIILNETNSVYPENLRTMADLCAGWLRKA